MEIKPVAHDPVAGPSGCLLRPLAQIVNVNIHDLFAHGADQVRVGVWIAVVTIAVITEAELQYPPISLSTVTVL